MGFAISEVAAVVSSVVVESGVLPGAAADVLEAAVTVMLLEAD